MIHNKKHTQAAIVIAGATLLVAAAVFLLQGLGPQAKNLGATVACYNGCGPVGSYSECLTYGGTCTSTKKWMYAKPKTVAPGQQVTIFWGGYCNGGFCPTANGSPTDAGLWDSDGVYSGLFANTVKQVDLSTFNEYGSFTRAPLHTTTYYARQPNTQTGTSLLQAVATVVAYPTVSIDAGAGNGVALSVPVGSAPVSIVATFAPGAGDTLTNTAIDYPNGTHVSTPGWATVGTQNYTFSPTTEGTYTFYATAASASYPAPASYRSVTITVTPIVTISCSADGTQATVSWTSSAYRYLVYGDYIPNNNASCSSGWLCSTPPDYSSGYLTSPSYTFQTTPGAQYRAQPWNGFFDPRFGISWSALSWNPFSCQSSTPTVSVSAPDPSAGETGGDTGTFTISLSFASSSPVVVNYTLSGSATNGTDYQTLSGSTTIAAGQVSNTVVLYPLADQSYEGNETAILTVSPNANYTIGVPQSASVSIVDAEAPNQVPILGSANLTPASARVRKGDPTNITWNVSGLILQDTCTITTIPPSALSSPLIYTGGTTTWTTDTAVALNPINSRTIVTLTCAAPDGLTQSSVSKILNIIPVVQEI